MRTEVDRLDMIAVGFDEEAIANERSFMFRAISKLKQIIYGGPVITRERRIEMIAYANFYYIHHGEPPKGYESYSLDSI